MLSPVDGYGWPILLIGCGPASVCSEKITWVLESAWAGGAHTAIVIRPKDATADLLRAAVALEEKGELANAAKSYRDIVRQDRARPAARTERTDRGQRQHLRRQRQNRAMG